MRQLRLHAAKLFLFASEVFVRGLGWIDSKQLDSDGQLKPCTAPQCGGFTLEAELGIAKNSSGEPDFLGWEVKQFAVEDFERIESAKPITMMTPEPDGGFYKDTDVEAFIRKFGYADKNDKPDRLNFGGRHVVGVRCPPTGLTMQLAGFDAAKGKITDANGEIALVSDAGEVAASWSFKKILEHWAHKHAKAVYVPSKRQTEPNWQYAYGHKVRLAQGTDSLRLLRAFAAGAMYYDPGIKLEQASTERAKAKKRSQFRVASRNITALYETVETVAV
ncbi:MAG: MvaI/BcnI family restriction endonuclease [Verrucomicrobiota bacterium]